MNSIKINPPEGYEVDKEKSTFKEIVFKPITLTYTKVYKELFKNKTHYTTVQGLVIRPRFNEEGENLCDDAASKEQVRKILALNQLLNIATYYNNRHPNKSKYCYTIVYTRYENKYDVYAYNLDHKYGLDIIFNKQEDAQAVINNINFKNILDRLYK